MATTLRDVARAPAPFSAWLGVVLTFLVFGVIVLAIIGPSPRGDDYEQKRAKARLEKLKMLHDEEAKALTSYSWIDKNKGIVRLPIARAIELTTTELTAKKPVPAGPITTATPAPQAAPAPAGNASPSPSPVKAR